jgi:hypothetical protein
MHTPRPISRFSGLIASALTMAVVVATFCVRSSAQDAFGPDSAREYRTASFDDAITRLQARIDSGSVKLAFSREHGYLPSVLRALDISPASQVLVFSKTSFQKDLISPAAPRSLYFNDRAYVGWVQGGPVLELSSADPLYGASFYTLPQVHTAHPKIMRQTDACLECHQSRMTGDVPGHIMRSVFASADGSPDFAAGSYLTTDKSPLSERWGGWYVTGLHGRQRHMGNMTAHGSDHDPTLDREKGANVANLAKFVDTRPYLAPTSDIVALMVLEHQTNVTNLLVKANYECRDALRSARVMNEAFGDPPDKRRESTERYLRSFLQPVLEALFFTGETRLTDPVSGSPAFVAQFERGATRDNQGRSLRDLDLRTRLLRYPCSYLIYSDSVDALPPDAKTILYSRMADILSGRDTSPEFAHLTATDRQSVREILLDTRPDFARAWRNGDTPVPRLSRAGNPTARPPAL